MGSGGMAKRAKKEGQKTVKVFRERGCMKSAEIAESQPWMSESVIDAPPIPSNRIGFLTHPNSRFLRRSKR
jgi:hypothetical protein